ncbi:hypothetical protein P7K49_021319, partial [Saguinus oedipus]
MDGIQGREEGLTSVTSYLTWLNRGSGWTIEVVSARPPNLVTAIIQRFLLRR